MFQPLPGMVCAQFASGTPSGNCGPNQTSVEPSGLVTRPLSKLLTLGNRWSVCRHERVWLSYRVKDQLSLAGMFGGRCTLYVLLPSSACFELSVNAAAYCEPLPTILANIAGVTPVAQ